ncbi:MAG: tetratricopeptide repeat protein [Tannerella sp.]|jgi:tetratricopeptide (TPR) repeat protein|nr:tetratricopeptide repeat protein [Tannerella sp.]
MRRFVLSGILWILLFAVGEHARAQTYEEMIEKSYDYVDKNDLPAAGECLKAAMRLEPGNRNNYALLTNLGTLQRRQGKLDDALVSYTAALNQQPKNEMVLSNRAELYTEMNETEKALSDYQVLLSVNPLNEDALFHRGLIYFGMQNLILAEADFERILDINKETIQGRLGYALLEKVRKNYDSSEAIFNYLISKRPEYWRLYEERAELYHLMNKNGRAMADLNKVFAEDPSPSAELYVLRGRVKLAQYEKASAAIDFKKALSMGYDAETIEKLLKQTY